MANKNSQEHVCRPHCMFFKDGAKEEMSCRGVDVLEMLVKRQRVNIAKMPPLKKKPGLWKEYKDLLSRFVCSGCSFRAEDCDFQAEGAAGDVEPCGGFIVLAHLKANNLITESDLER